jgi:hypothetical protein
MAETVAVAGLMLTRDPDSTLHAAASGLPESFAVTATALQLLRLKHNPAAYITTSNRLVVRTVEDTAVYDLSAMDSTGVLIASRCA